MQAAWDPENFLHLVRTGPLASVMWTRTNCPFLVGFLRKGFHELRGNAVLAYFTVPWSFYASACSTVTWGQGGTSLNR